MKAVNVIRSVPTVLNKDEQLNVLFEINYFLPKMRIFLFYKI